MLIAWDLGNGAPQSHWLAVHTGCFEIIAKENIRRIAGLKGKTVGWYPAAATETSRNCGNHYGQIGWT